MSRSSKIVKMAIKKANIDGNIISDESDEGKFKFLSQREFLTIMIDTHLLALEPAENPWKAFNQWKYGCEDIVPTPEKNDYEDTISELDNSSESWKKPSDATTDTGSDIISYIDDDLTEDINYESKNKDGEKKTYAVMSQLNPYSYTDEPVDSHENNEITNTDIPSSVHVSASKSTGSIENPINSDENDETSNTCRPSSVHASVSESTALIQKAVGCIGGSDKKIIVEGSKRKIRMWDKRDRCLYCNEDVTNFSRHLFRKHKTEQTVIMIMDLPKGDKTRATMINSMRKNGNFNAIEKSEIIRPIQRLNLKTSELPNISEFMPCPYCKGIYRKASLNKHAKKCLQNENKESKDKVNTQSLGQNLLAFNASKTNFINKSRIKNEVYSRMHADNIALIGKSDPVISQYGDDYLKKHKRPHIRNAVSNKVREMGRLLLQLRKIYNIQTMIQALNTKHYDKVVHAAHIISGYDPEQKIFKAPSLAMHMRTNLLYVCSACKTLLLKKDPVLPVLNHAEELKKVKAFRNLVQERWKFDMGSLAQKDLVEKHSEKSSNIPITSDVIKFQSHVLELCETNYKDLKKDPKDKTAYKNLNEATLVYTMMHNRKRSGDAQYTRLDSYTKTVMERSQEEFMSNLTEAEKLLNSQYKRITTLGEGSKRVAILFPKRIQTYMELLISIRGNFVKPMNPYLFADTNSVEWINGPYLMSKFAKSCCASHPETLTSTRLRKQIATVLQALNLSPTEKEQLASFMGHTEKTHNEYYRLVLIFSRI